MKPTWFLHTQRGFYTHTHTHILVFCPTDIGGTSQRFYAETLVKNPFKFKIFDYCIYDIFQLYVTQREKHTGCPIGKHWDKGYMYETKSFDL